MELVMLFVSNKCEYFVNFITQNINYFWFPRLGKRFMLEKKLYYVCVISERVFKKQAQLANVLPGATVLRYLVID